MMACTILLCYVGSVRARAGQAANVNDTDSHMQYNAQRIVLRFMASPANPRGVGGATRTM
ncbi:hypothetical protein CY34DRAFT_272462 [Suillus luteus UH-Slu-Lm8-n1]|uniref:Uncharacterized protein n=1 Tax=Suillus luteus UH-Slu-Lm8-n1 TaxID=930992 RepID=A0A0D0AQM5_9AGAM|nr:hypothetical protein CY34DRAFT_272462 [Suillus luteus UH-Slu-Lm8-n1]